MWTKEKLLEVKTKTIKICGDDVIIRKLNAGEVFDKSKSDEEKSMAMICYSLVDPAVKLEDVKIMPIERFNALLEEIMNFNGMDKKEANQGN